MFGSNLKRQGKVGQVQPEREGSSGTGIIVIMQISSEMAGENDGLNFLFT